MDKQSLVAQWRENREKDIELDRERREIESELRALSPVKVGDVVESGRLRETQRVVTYIRVKVEPNYFNEWDALYEIRLAYLTKDGRVNRHKRGMFYDWHPNYKVVGHVEIEDELRGW